MMRRYLTVLLVFHFVALTANSASSQTTGKKKISPTLSVTDAAAWKSVQKGIESRKITLERSEPGYTLDLKLLRFDTQWITARLLRSAEYQLKAANAMTFLERSGAVAAINANYFDTGGKPLAFLKAGGQAVNPRVSRSSLYTGVFGVKDQRPFISHRDDFFSEQADEGMQSGPLLLLRGAPQAVTGVPLRASRRALIGIDREQRLMIAGTDNLIGGLFWAELQEIFSAGSWQVQAQDLLNLDGGGSAQLYIKAGKFEEFVPGTVEVPVAIGFFAKSQ
ncbi:MAG: phosphodiester glycosidase family protein [Deltaproteobacteria bacterium]|nr:phosphodiester glycosidase family protein [Deltaproteobacteria bacterium]